MTTMKSVLNSVNKHVRPGHIALLGAVVLVLLMPTIAFAIPGAGELTASESPTGREMGELYNLLAKICLVIFSIVAAVMVAALLRFRRKSDDEQPEQIHGDLRVEFGILIAATIVQIFIGYKTIEVMWYVETIPETEMTVEAIGYQWDWQFRYPDHGGFISDDLVIPAHTNVKILVTSKDVIHSLFIPELGVKMDAVPGRFNYWWVNANGPVNQVVGDQRRVTPKNERTYDTTRKSYTATEILNQLTFFPDADKLDLQGYETLKDGTVQPISGLERRVDYLAASRTVEEVSPYEGYDAIEYRGMCTELCGKGHYDMYFRTVAMTSSSFERWVEAQKSGGGKEADGPSLYQKNCSTCHGAEGQGIVGQFPPLVNTRWTNVDSDESKTEHITVVLAGLKGEIEVAGVKYNGVMQPWFNVLNDEEVAAVVNHERVSWGNNGGTVDAEMVAAVRKDLGYPAFGAGGAAPLSDEVLLEEGKRIYDACTSCHGEQGEAAFKGNAKLANHPTVLANPRAYVDMLVNGVDGVKTAMGASLSDREIAALITYTRKALSNSEASAVQPDEVKRLRAEVQKN